MDKKEIIGLALSSAVIGAIASAVITAALTLFGQWRDRIARRRELLLTFAVDLSKTYMQRMSSHSKPIGTLPEVVVLSGMHRMLTEALTSGRVSAQDIEAVKRAAESV